MNLNYTYYLKLVGILNKDKKEIKNSVRKEQDYLKERVDTSLWGGTTAQKTYLEILDNILKGNSSLLRKKRLDKIRNDIESNFDFKIRIVFFCYEFQTFTSFMPVYNKMKNDNQFICRLVHIPFFHVDKIYDAQAELDEYKKNGYKEIIEADDYKLNEENPDVAFFLKPYDTIPKKYYIDEIEKVIDKSIYIPYGMEIGATKESMRYQFQLPLHDKAWYCISYCTKHYENACKYSKQKGKNYLMIGHPRMDLINQDLSSEKDTKTIKKLIKGRPIFMYNPHFTIKDGEDNWGSFKIYGMDILNYFSNHKELFLIYRPHPFLEGALKEEYNDDFLKQYNDLLEENKDNIYLDKSGNYLIAMHLANYLISDANSFVPEFLAYNKPVIYTKKMNTTGFNNPNLEKMLYICQNKDDIIEKINTVMDDDYKGKSREKDIKRVFNYDKEQSVSDKIIDIIKDYYK